MKTRIIVALSAIFLFAVFSGAAGAEELRSLKAIPGLMPGSILVLEITGDVHGGSLWGTELYTGDSSLAAAAVHAGILVQGQKGQVVVEVLPGEPVYRGSSSNGVTSASWDSYGTSFRFLNALPTAQGSSMTGRPSQSNSGVPASPVHIYGFEDPSILVNVRTAPGSVLYFRIAGSIGGRVWGTGAYTLDSSLSSAAVHAGLLAPGQTGILRVTVLPGRSSYEGSVHNGVTTMSYGAYGASYGLELVAGNFQFEVVMANPGTPASISGVAPGKSYAIWVTGSASGSAIWGSGIYTADSPLAKAVVQAGLISDGGSGGVVVHVLPGQSSYAGTMNNGVGSNAYGSYGLSYSLEALR